MLIESKIDNSTWMWINIPKTASTLLRNTFKEVTSELDGQSHYTYKENVELYGEHTAFTVVRDPLTRFVSGLNHVFSECTCGQCIIKYDVLPTTKEVLNFLREITELASTIKNFHYKTYYNGTDTSWMLLVKSMQKHFIKNRIITNPFNCVMWSFILPQYLYLDGMRSGDYIFRYEDMSNCVTFIRDKLGYEVDLNKRVRSYSYKLNNVDFENTEIKKLLYQYYETDYTQLNY